jgi:hypothetical protein
MNDDLPQLRSGSSGGNIILTWPTNYAGFDYSGYTLQSAADLDLPIWTTEKGSTHNMGRRISRAPAC